MHYFLVDDSQGNIGPFDSFELADAHGMEWLNQDHRINKGWWFEVAELVEP